MRIFIDTGAFIARYLSSDQHHDDATAGWDLIAQSGWRCYTSSFVLDETITLLGRRASYAFAAAKARSLLTSKELRILRPTASDELSAVDWLKKYADQKISYTDCVSFVLMEGAGIKPAFTFDRHFRIAGFEVWPSPTPQN